MKWPKVLFGTSGLGNLYSILPEATKQAIVQKILIHSKGIPVFDTAGKYGAGLALSSLGSALRSLGAGPDSVMISNKLGWLQTELKGPEPTFEAGVWKGLTHDAVQAISYEGIMACYEQGNTLLNGYEAKMLSVHDPDEYLAAAENAVDGAKRYQDILEAYQALHTLKKAGKIYSVGIGAKDWRVIQKISRDTQLDWVMIANSMTLHSHPKDLGVFMKQLAADGIHVINSAVFNAGFLTGSDYYNYRLLDPQKDAALYTWRQSFFNLCDQFGVRPVEAAVVFGRCAPGVSSIALNTTHPERVAANIAMADAIIVPDFWQAMLDGGLIRMVPVTR